MDTWTLERAKNGVSEVVRRALDHKPQLVTRGRRGEDAVVVISKEDYEKLVAPQNMWEFFRNSPLAEAIAAGDIPEDAFDRPREIHDHRDVDFG